MMHWKDTFRFAKHRGDIAARHPSWPRYKVDAEAERNIEIEDMEDGFARVDERPFGEWESEHQSPEDWRRIHKQMGVDPHPQPLTEKTVHRNPQAMRGLAHEQWKNPGWSHHHLMNLVFGNLQKNPRMYSPEWFKEQKQQKQPNPEDSCKTCRHFTQLLEPDGQEVGWCDHHRRNRLGRDFCDSWDRRKAGQR
jgi:hypothetical protein